MNVQSSQEKVTNYLVSLVVLYMSNCLHYSTDLLRNLSNVCDNFNFWRVFVLCIGLNFDSFIVEIMTAIYVFNFTL
jgi:hypothetical protein